MSAALRMPATSRTTTSSRQAAALTRPPAGRALVPARVPPAPLGGASLVPAPLERDVVRRGLFGLGLPELAVIAGVAALIFGPSKLPSLGKELGKTAKSFQTAAKEFEKELKSAAAEEEGEKKE